MLKTRRRSIVTRSLFKSNIGGSESNPYIQGNANQISYDGAAKLEEPATLLQKAGLQVGRILEGGTEIVTAPSRIMPSNSVRSVRDDAWEQKWTAVVSFIRHPDSESTSLQIFFVVTAMRTYLRQPFG